MEPSVIQFLTSVLIVVVVLQEAGEDSGSVGEHSVLQQAQLGCWRLPLPICRGFFGPVWILQFGSSQGERSFYLSGQVFFKNGTLRFPVSL